MAWWATVYQMWHQRNAIIHARRAYTDYSEDYIISNIKKDAKGRMKSKKY